MMWPIWKKIGIGFAIAAIVLTIISTGIYLEFNSVRETQAAVRRTDSLIVELERLLLVQRDLESGQRGYIITGKDDFLIPYVRALDKYNRQFDIVRRLSAESSVQQNRLIELRNLFTERINFAQTTIRLRRDSGFAAAESIFTTGKGQILTNKIREIISAMEEDEKSRLQVRIERSEESYRYIAGFVLVGGAISTFLIIVTGAFITQSINRSISKLMQGIRSIRGGNLRHHVVVDTADEIGELAESFNLMAQDLDAARTELEKNNFSLEAESEKLQKMNEELQHKNELLEVLNQEKNEFLGIAAHDLKNPLYSIRGLADMLLKNCESGKLDISVVEEYCEDIRSSSNQMFDLITNLLDVNIIEQGSKYLHPDRFELHHIAEHVMSRYLMRADAKNISINFTAQDAVSVLADRSAVAQVIDNLISNAVKYSPRGKNIFISIGKNSSEAIFEVRDEGPGLSEADMKKLFQKFTRLSARPTGGEHSTGLGLSIVKRLTELMGGKIYCESELGSGAKFVVLLPLAQ